MADIFISYARDDRAKVETLVVVLESEGYSVWWDSYIAGGAEFSKDIERELEASKAVIVGWSNQSIDSRWVKDEAGLAADAGKLVPISLDGAAAPIGFKQFHVIDFAADEDAAIANLKRSLAVKLGEEDKVAEKAFVSPTSSQSSSRNFADPKIMTGAAIGLLAIVVVGIVFLRQPSGPGDRASDETAEQANAVEETGDQAPTLSDLDKSIAVLPFANRSPDPNDAFFAQGMHDDLLAQLSKITDMRVISRTSVMGYVGADRKIPEIAAELGVATIMEGSVQRAGDRVRINVQLIHGETDEHLWAEIYDRDLTADNIFDIQSEITLAIAGALQSVLTPDDHADLADRPTQSLAAYDAYLRGVVALSDLENREQAINDTTVAFEAAIAQDPNFAAAYAGLARGLLRKYWFSGQVDSSLVDTARANLNRANALAPESVETLVAWGYYHYWGFLDYDSASESIDRALARAPNDASVWELKAYVARRAGRFEEALRALNKAIDLNPLGPLALGSLQTTLTLLGRFDEAREIIERGYAVSQEREIYLAAMADSWFHQGNVERGCEILDSAEPEADWEGYVYWAQAHCAYFSRDLERLDRAFANMPAAARNFWPGYPEHAHIMKAFALGALGREEEAHRIGRKVAERLKIADDSYPAGWSQTAGYWRTDVPALLHDLKGLRSAVRDFEEKTTADAFAEAELYFWFAQLFAYVGDFDTSFDYLDRSMHEVGPVRFPFISIEPMFDDMRDDPRYLKLQTEYESWAAKSFGSNQ